MRTMIAVPCMDMVHTDFMRSCLGLELRGEVQYTFAQASLIYDARNRLSGSAVEEGFDRVLWLDSDVRFDSSLFRQLSEHLDSGLEIVSGLYFSRKPPIHPVIYSSCSLRTNADGRGQTPSAETCWDYPENGLFQVAACGFGAVMMTTDLLRRVIQRFGLPFSPILGFGEDLSFCMKLHELGVPIWCDAGVKLGHVGIYTYTAADAAAPKRGENA